MAFTVVLQPSGRTFTAEAEETLLTAALRAGIAVKYNCNNGSCGQCRAKLLDGKLGPIAHHDFSLAAQDKQDNVFLLCRAKPETDLTLEVHEIGDVREIPQQQLETKVYKLDEASDNVRILQLRTPRSQTLQFLAGQYATLEIDGLAPRNKSIASCPCNGMYLQFHVRNTPDDPFAEYIFNHIKNKQKVMVSGPHGDFVLDENSQRPMIFIANDTGFAPIKSLIEHCIAIETEQALHLYWLTEKNEGHYLSNYCRSWEDALEDFTYTPVIIDELSQLSEKYRSQAFLNLARRITDEYPALQDYDVYLNGPAPLYSGMNEILHDHGLPHDRLFIDSVAKY